MDVQTTDVDDVTILSILDIKNNSPRDRLQSQRSPNSNSIKGGLVNQSNYESIVVIPTEGSVAPKIDPIPTSNYKQFKQRITTTLQVSLILCCIMASISIILGLVTCIRLEDAAQM